MLLRNQEKQSLNYSKFSLFIRSLIFNTYSVIAICIYSCVCVLLLPLSLSARFKAINGFLIVYFWVLKVVCHLDYEITGLENIPQDRVGIICSKHQSTFETFLLPLLFHDPAPIAKRELAWIPFFGWALMVFEPIMINRNDKRSAMQQILEKGKKCLQQGRWILFFPEGTRIPYGKVGQYRLGGTRLAVAANAPLIPVAHNAGRYWPRRKFIKYPGTIKVAIGPLLESTGETPETLMEKAKTWIEDTVKEL